MPPRVSFGDILKPDKLAQSFQAPVTQLPKQMASISKLKNLSHGIEQDTWEKMVQSMTTEMKMREQEVKLQQLLRTGGLIDREMACLENTRQLPEDADPKLVAARKKWRERLGKDRDSWLKQAQDKARQLEAAGPPLEISDVAQLGTRQTIYALRQQEIQHASVVWMMDETCWSR